ncbi:hypothetical protein CEXT_413831 [Caerostris extrusa]|uniref:Fibrillin first EGF domain-containing protein n=1 Tax=Caerostris extrusa TaxID=172846 RepID=A0AAV4QE79_CAEEX|nr:hypothetical protein CEXT_413831 [Caerostris extrusa]
MLVVQGLNSSSGYWKTFRFSIKSITRASNFRQGKRSNPACAICRASCGDGRCIRPNLCFCPNRQVRPSCDGPGLPGLIPGGNDPNGIGPGNVVGPGTPQQPGSKCS